MRHSCIVIAATMTLAACNQAAKPDVVGAASARRLQDTQAILQAGAQTSTSQTPEGTVITLRVPTPAMGGQFVNIRNCIVWRDAVTKTSSLHCDREEIDVHSYPTDKPSPEQ